VAWGKDERGEAREQLGGRHDDVRGALALVLALVGDAAVPGQAQPLEHQRRAKDVAAEPLAAVTIGSSSHNVEHSEATRASRHR